MAFNDTSTVPLLVNPNAAASPQSSDIPIYISIIAAAGLLAVIIIVVLVVKYRWLRQKRKSYGNRSGSLDTDPGYNSNTLYPLAQTTDCTYNGDSIRRINRKISTSEMSRSFYSIHHSLDNMMEISGRPPDGRMIACESELLSSLPSIGDNYQKPVDYISISEEDNDYDMVDYQLQNGNSRIRIMSDRWSPSNISDVNNNDYQPIGIQTQCSQSSDYQPLKSCWGTESNESGVVGFDIEGADCNSTSSPSGLVPMCGTYDNRFNQNGRSNNGDNVSSSSSDTTMTKANSRSCPIYFQLENPDDLGVNHNEQHHYDSVYVPSNQPHVHPINRRTDTDNYIRTLQIHDSRQSGLYEEIEQREDITLPNTDMSSRIDTDSCSSTSDYRSATVSSSEVVEHPYAGLRSRDADIETEIPPDLDCSSSEDEVYNIYETIERDSDYDDSGDVPKRKVTLRRAPTLPKRYDFKDP